MTQPAERVAPIESVQNAPLHIVLVEPQIPPNTGNIARLCAATGCALHLVAPLGFSIEDRELKRAGLDYWESLQVVVHDSLDAFLATTTSDNRWLLTTRATESYREARFVRGDFLVFGKETAGLPDVLVRNESERTLRVPMRPDAVRSLNLSTAVGIVAYEALAQIGFPAMR